MNVFLNRLSLEKMKLTVLQENLHQGINVVSRFVASKAQLPVLGNVLLATDKQRLRLTATNLETGINYWVGAKVEKEGAISVPARMLAEFVNSLPADKIDIEVAENSMKLKSAGFEASLIGMQANDFPAVPTVKEKAEILLTFKNLPTAFSQVVFAAAQDEGRPVLGGVLLKIKDKRLILVATDGYRLSLKKVEGVGGIEGVEAFQKGLLIPAKTLGEVAKLVVEKEKQTSLGLTITPGANQVVFSLGEAEIVSRLIEGEFPDFEKIIPQKGGSRLVFDREQFLRAVKIGAIFARESANIIKLETSKKGLRVSANAPQLGDNVSEIEAKTEGEGGKIAFNSKYLLDFVNSVEEETINLETSGPLNPGVFTAGDDSSYLHIIMPVRVQE